MFVQLRGRYGNYACLIPCTSLVYFARIYEYEYITFVTVEAVIQIKNQAALTYITSHIYILRLFTVFRMYLEVMIICTRLIYDL